jgi:glutamyl-tRNA reductase
MTVSSAEMPKALAGLGNRPHLSEVVVFSTCMRIELYAVATRYHAAMVELRDFIAEWSGQPIEAFADHLYSYFDDAAVNHLFRVAAGLDSAVLGETEVLRQVRDAWELGRDEGASGPILNGAFRHALEVGKRVRSETAIARGTTSLSHAAVELAEQQLEGLAGRQPVVIGAGEIGAAAAKAFAVRTGALPPVVVNRSPARGAELAAVVGGRAVSWEKLTESLIGADVVVSCTGSRLPVLTREALAAAAGARARRSPLLVIDLAVPRDVEPAAAADPGVTLVDLDQLKDFAAAAVAERRREIPAAERIIAEEVVRYLDAVASRGVAPLVTALRDRAEEIRAAELVRYRRRLGQLGPEQEAAVERLTRSIVAKLLHDPTVNLKAAAGTTEGEGMAAALQRLFDLER